MYLKSLEIQGFKSFPDKTMLTFGKGITAVVGPNGSGKSNISDAIRWVLGEMSAKTLRGGRMEDVIFGGTVARKAQGFAEVSLTVDNSNRELSIESDEVTVTRRYYRSGESDYLLNRAEVRLRDIHELFMDTGLGRDGYSVIGQGKIAEIVAAKSEDRREIFEEAAGISKFRYRKEESERRLASAEENLVRLRDIETELEGRLEPLKEQSEKAKKYLEYASEKKTLEVGLWLYNLDRQRDVLREHENRLALSRAQYDEIVAKLESAESEIEAGYFEVQKKAALIESLRNDARGYSEEAEKKLGEAAVFTNDINHNNENISRIESEIEEALHSSEDLTRELEDHKAELDRRLHQAEELAEKLAACEQGVLEITRQNDEFAGKNEGLTTELSRRNVKLTELRLNKSGAETTATHLTARLSEIDADLLNRGGRREQTEKELQGCINALEACNDNIDSLNNSLKGYELKLNSRRAKLSQLEESLRTLSLEQAGKLQRANMLAELEKSMEGFAHSVKTVMREKGRNTLKGIHGPVSRLINVPAKYAVAVEMALGGAMQHIVVDNEQSAKEAIGYLKRSDGGRATFLPITSVRGRALEEGGLAGCDGYLGVASELIGFDSRYEGVITNLLGRTVIAEDINSAVSIAQRYGYRFRIVTLDGQLVNAGGSLTGGSMNKSAGLLSRRDEIDTLTRAAESLKARIEQGNSDKKTLAAEVSSLEASVSGIRGELSTAQEEKIRFEGDHKRLTEQLEAALGEVESLEAEKERSAEQIAAQQGIIAEADSRIEAETSAIESLQAELEQLGADRGELLRQREQQAEQLNDLRMQSMTCQKDIEVLQVSINALEQQQAGREGRVQELRAQTEELKIKNNEIEAMIAGCRAEAQSLKAKSEEATTRAAEVSAEREEAERKATELRGKERGLTEDKEKISKEVGRLEERKDAVQRDYDGLIARLWDDYELTRTEAEKIAEPIAEPGKAQRRLNELKNGIKNLGSVNVGAIEEYKEVSERYEFLSTQIADVEQSKRELLKLIEELTGKMREIFAVKFKEINENFTQTFIELFGGGTAHLELSEPEDVLNSGIDLTVQPPGKIIKSLTALSGGEQAFVAIALYFAILKVNPSPFCVLDEIEAALDDANVSRYAQYLRRMCDNTQFIVITHRRGTMDEADVLYGVTMQEEGISKLLTLNVSQLAQRLGIGA